MRWAVLVALALSAGCGDDDDGGGNRPDAAVADAASPRRDASTADARPAGDDAAAPDASFADAGPPDANADLLPDLTVEAITRDALYYVVQYCNRGDGVGASTPFRVRLSSLTTSGAFQTGAVFTAPAAGTCAMTGGITCGLIGDPGCELAGGVVAEVDSSRVVVELNESNNTFAETF